MALKYHFILNLQQDVLRLPLTLVLDALPLSGLGALDDGLAEEGAHLLDPETNSEWQQQATTHTKLVIKVNGNLLQHIFSALNRDGGIPIVANAAPSTHKTSTNAVTSERRAASETCRSHRPGWCCSVIPANKKCG